MMDKVWRGLELLAAKARIEKILIANGIQVDEDCKEGISRALWAFVYKANLDIDDAERRVAISFMDTRVAKAA
jgi:hypothetical protein